MTVTGLTLGASSLGARHPEPDALELAAALLRSPFGQVDTSNAYAGGRSEALLGAVLRDWSEPGRPATIFSKADADPATGGFDGDRVKRSFEETVERLGVDHLPIYHLHDPYGITLAEATAPGGAVEAMVALREQGLVGAIGIAAGRRRLVEEYVRTGAFDAVLTHNRYTLVDTSAASIIAAAKERGMLVFNAAPFGGGILAGSANARGRYGYRPAPPELLGHVDRLTRMCREWRVPLAAAALHFSLTAPGVDSTVVGVSDLGRLAELEKLAAFPIPDGFFAAVAGLGTPPTTTLDD
ncbi:aldo/keto reductase [Plantactinospora mayteni]|uniref:Oxidoreductase n=1 Tax=Plantactinospora mayteni TaxID=566021 RepID=A0ABQ4F070_9ACTN|nr:aldo/keto reductase [Plantactinospora mayteni]GIH00265.1 oxidoreductase [Plantactinospora mayteni]